MSLINQMLKDLESRRNPQLPAAGVLPGESPVQTNKSMRPLTGLLLLLVVLLSLGLAYTLWQQKEIPAERAAVASQAAPAAAPVAAPKATPRTAPPGTTVTVKPQTATTVTAPRPQAAQPESRGSVTTGSARLNSITPSVIDGSWQTRSFTLKGEELSRQNQIVVNWAGNEKVLPHERVEWLDASTARIKLVTGNSDEIWQVALLRSNGSRSNSVEFEVIASPGAGNQNEEITTPLRIEKTIRPPTKSEQANQLYQQGYRALQQRQATSSDKAERLWQQALKTDPAHLKSVEGLLALYLSQGRKIEAAELLESGISYHPDNAQFALLRARLLTEQGNTSAAIATLEQATGNAVQQPELFALLAALYQQQRDYNKSIDSYQRALQLQPQQSNWWMGLAISLEGATKNAEAISAYKEAQQRGRLNKESQSYVRQRLEALE